MPRKISVEAAEEMRRKRIVDTRRKGAAMAKRHREAKEASGAQSLNSEGAVNCNIHVNIPQDIPSTNIGYPIRCLSVTVVDIAWDIPLDILWDTLDVSLVSQLAQP